MFSATGPELLRPVGECEFANGVAAMSASGGYGSFRVNAAIIPFANLAAGSAVAETLEAHQARAGRRFRGIRQVAIWHASSEPYAFIVTRPPRGLMTNPEFQKGFAELAGRGLTFDTAIFHPQLEELAALADRFPKTTIVLNHLGFAMGMGCDAEGRQTVFKQWRSGLQELARRENVVVKIGGLGMPFWGFGLHERAEPIHSDELCTLWRPYVETGIELFGADRCMMESNFPADGHSCGYVPLWNAMKKLTRGYSIGERTRLFSGTASRVYGLEQR
jgi:predicted TIM-barrel fold metal-dependent hydrolase